MAGYITGDKELDRTFRSLNEKVKSRITRAALSAALTQIAKEARRGAPRGATGQTKKAIGKSVGKDAAGQRTGKVGIGVGKKLKSLEGAPHAHLVALGTKQRRHKSGHRTGQVNRNAFIAEAYQRAGARAVAKLVEILRTKILKEASKRR